MSLIPEDLKIFTFIYEYHSWLIIPLLILWFSGSVFWIIRLKKIFFLWLLIFPLFIQPLNITAVWCGWHYRMEIYKRFAKSPYGGHDIDRMPPEIRAEYAKHNYRPRFRDIKAMVAGTILITPLLYASGGILFLISGFARKKVKKYHFSRRNEQ